MCQGSKSAEAQSITFRPMLTELKPFQEVNSVDATIADDRAAKDSVGDVLSRKRRFYSLEMPFSTATKGVRWSGKVLETSIPRTWVKIACWVNYTLDNILRGEYGNWPILLSSDRGKKMHMSR